MKKLLYVLIALVLTVTVGVRTTQAAEDFFSKMFEGVDFEALAKEMEKIIEEEGGIDAVMGGAGFPGPGLGEKKPDLSGAAPTTTTKPVTVDLSGKNKKDLFLEDFQTPKQQGPAPQKTIFPREKTGACHYYLDTFTDHLNTVQKGLNSMQFNSPDFEGIATDISLTIDKITVALHMIKHKKMYIKVFYTAAFKPIREKIVAALPQLEKVTTDITKLALKEDGDMTMNNFARAMAAREKKPARPAPQAPKAPTKKLPGSEKKAPNKRAPKAAPRKIVDPLSPLENDLKTLFTQELSFIASALEKTLDTQEVKKAIEDKKKQREASAKQAAQRNSALGGRGRAGGGRRPASPYASNGTPRQGSYGGGHGRGGGGYAGGSSPYKFGRNTPSARGFGGPSRGSDAFGPASGDNNPSSKLASNTSTPSSSSSSSDDSKKARYAGSGKESDEAKELRKGKKALASKADTFAAHMQQKIADIANAKPENKERLVAELDFSALANEAKAVKEQAASLTGNKDDDDDASRGPAQRTRSKNNPPAPGPSLGASRSQQPTADDPLQKVKQLATGLIPQLAVHLMPDSKATIAKIGPAYSFCEELDLTKNDKLRQLYQERAQLVAAHLRKRASEAQTKDTAAKAAPATGASAAPAPASSNFDAIKAEIKDICNALKLLQPTADRVPQPLRELARQLNIGIAD